MSFEKLYSKDNCAVIAKALGGGYELPADKCSAWYRDNDTVPELLKKRLAQDGVTVEMDTLDWPRRL